MMGLREFCCIRDTSLKSLCSLRFLCVSRFMVLILEIVANREGFEGKYYREFKNICG